MGLRLDAEQLAQVKLLVLLVALSACGARSDLSTPVADELSGAGAASSAGGSPPHTKTPETAAMQPEPGMAEPEPGAMNPAPGSTDPEPDPLSNANCTPSNAKGGMACAEPCVTSCGFHGIGTKTCDCVSGVFVSCHCPRPWDYQGHTTAPACATPDGRTHWIDNTACADEWTQCIGSDPVAGTNPRGCVCLTDPVNGKLEWTCGSTNKWFLAE